MVIPIATKNEIRTQRLTLRPFEVQDTEPIKKLLRNEKISLTYMVPDLTDEAKADQLAAKLIEYSRPEDTKHLIYGIFAGSRLIGLINDCGEEDSAIEIGYVIDPAEWGKGYATEAFGAVLAELKEMGFEKACAAYFEENPASRRVMEKCGLRDMNVVTEIPYRGVTHKCIYLGIRFTD